MEKIIKRIELSKLYKFPSKFKVIKYKTKILVIAIDTARWIVLDSEKQLDIFNLLQQHTLEETIAISDASQNDIMSVVTQIEARHLERSEEHTSELQSPDHLVCRLLL